MVFFYKNTRYFYGLVLLFCLTACDAGLWNNPHADEEEGKIVLYSNFSNRPKHLDPIRSYNRDEATFIDQIYEPPLEYHYLKRPFELQPSTLTEMPVLKYFDMNGEELLMEGDSEPAFSTYYFTLKPNIFYQPHPAFAKGSEGKSYYRFESAEDGDQYLSFNDFTEKGIKELVADDYIYQIKRMSNPRLAIPIWDLLSNYIVGMKELREEIKLIQETQDKNKWINLNNLDMSGLQKIDKYRFSITLKGKYPQFKYWLAFHFFAPIPMEVDRFYHLPGLVERNISLDFHPVGTGPFMMTKHKANEEIILERNPNFRKNFYPTEGEDSDKQKQRLVDAGKQLPLIDKVIFRLEKEAIPIWTKFLQGYYDRSGISSDSFDQAVSMGMEGISVSDEMNAKGVSLDMSSESATYYFAFNMEDDVVGGYDEKRKKLRRAIAIAYDEMEQISIFRNGRGEIAMSPVPPGVFGYDASEAGINPYVFDWVDGKPERKSLDIAKQLLAEAGYPNGRDELTGKPLVLNMDTTVGGQADNARQNWLIKQFKKLGIQLNIRATDYNRFQDKFEKSNVQIFFWGWFADYPDAENFLFLLYGPNSRAGSGGAGVNSSNYQNAEYDVLFNQMKSMEDSPERLVIIKKMLAIFHEDGPWASSFHPRSFVLSNSWVRNFKPHGISQANLKYLAIDTEQRNKMRQQWNQPVVWPLVITVLLFLLICIPGYYAYQRRQKRKVTSVFLEGKK